LDEESLSSEVFSTVNLYPSVLLDPSGIVIVILNLKAVLVLPVIVLELEAISVVPSRSKTVTFTATV